MINLAILASGNGTNAQKIIEYFQGNENIHVAVVFSNCADAKVLERTKKFSIEGIVFSKKDFDETDIVLNKLISLHIDFIVLAGFLWLVPEKIINYFPHKIINIHPALLPKFGGKGMYGMKVHESVLANKENESGITIHYVNKQFDEGEIIFQAKCKVGESDTPELLANKIHQLEHAYYSKVIESLLNKLFVNS